MSGLDVETPDSPPANTAPRTPAQEILWPSLRRGGQAMPARWQPDDEPRFPNPDVIRERRRRDDAGSHAPTFKACVSASLVRVLIMDPYLLCPGRRAEDEVLSWFPENFEAPEVKIMCGGVGAGRDASAFGTRLADAEAAVNRRKRGTGAPLSRFEVRLSLDPREYPFLHDRFAIVDDELWHFGSTVGGLHCTVNAATRGWDAVSTGARTFFEREVWNQRATRRRNSICEGGDR